MDELTSKIKMIKSDLPEPNSSLSETEKDKYITIHGYHLIHDISKAKKELPVNRLAHLFSSVDSQIVVDVIANDFTDALKRFRNEIKK